MVVLSPSHETALDQFPMIKTCKYKTLFTQIPTIELHSDKPNYDVRTVMVKACEEFGFFKLVNHGVPLDLISKLETEAINFFKLPQLEKDKATPRDPYGYGNKVLGPLGDIGWVEYIFLSTNPDVVSLKQAFIFHGKSDTFRSVVNNYISAMKKVACEVLELIAEGLMGIDQKDILSRLIKDEKSDCAFRLNHYPPCKELQALTGTNMLGFGEHTDPQLISVLRSNNITGLQICLKDGTWVSVPPDPTSFFINVGDLLQVMTNGRFRSVKHRALADALESRYSMVFFAAPSFSTKIVPLSSLFDEGEEDQEGETLYKEFTWWEYKKSVYKTKLTADRLRPFEKSAGAG